MKTQVKPQECTSSCDSKATEEELYYHESTVDIFENENEFVLQAELPGLLPQDIELDIQDDTLSIKGVAKPKERKEKLLIGGFESKNLSRTFKLTKKINTAEVRADYKHGLLTVYLPKRQPQSLKINVL